MAASKTHWTDTKPQPHPRAQRACSTVTAPSNAQCNGPYNGAPYDGRQRIPTRACLPGRKEASAAMHAGTSGWIQHRPCSQQQAHILWNIAVQHRSRILRRRRPCAAHATYGQYVTSPTMGCPMAQQCTRSWWRRPVWGVRSTSETGALLLVQQEHTNDEHTKVRSHL